MNTKLTYGVALLGSLLFAFLATGCATKPKTDWNARVGNYTFDQAVTDMGPPDRNGSLSDGSKVADWVTGHTGGSGLSVGFGSFGRNAGIGVSQSIGSGGREQTLRLTFDKDGKLASWKRN